MFNSMWSVGPRARALVVALAAAWAVLWLGPSTFGQARPDVVWYGAGTAASVCAVSPDGHRIVTSAPFNETALKLWRADGALVRTLAEFSYPWGAVAFSPDGQFIVAGHDGGGLDPETAAVFRVSDGTRVRGLSPAPEGSFFNVKAIAWSSAGVIAVAYDAFTGIELYDAATGNLLRVLEGGGQAAAFSPDGTLLAGSIEGGVRVWSVADGTTVRTINDAGNLVAYSPDGAHVAVGNWMQQNTAARIYRLGDGGLERTITPSRVQYPHALVFVPVQGTLVIAGSRDAAVPREDLSLFSDEAVQAYRLDGSVAWTYEHEYGIALSAAASGDGQTVVLAGGWRTASSSPFVEGSTDTIQRLRASDGVETLHFGAARGMAFGVAFSPDSAKLATAGGLTSQVWRTANGTVEHTFPNGGNSVCYSSDGARIAIGTDGPIQIWNAAGYTLERTLPGHGAFPTRQAVFSPDSTLVLSGGEDRTAKLWRVSDGGLVWTRSSNAGFVLSVAFSPDGTLAAAGCGSSTVRIWRVSDGQLLRSIVGQNAVDSIAFSPDGTKIAVAEQAYGDNLKVYNAADGSLFRALAGSQGFQKQSVSFTPDGAMVVFSSGGNLIQFWRLSDGVLAHEIGGETGTGPFPFLPAAVSPDGRWLGYARQDSTVMLARNPFGPADCRADIASLGGSLQPDGQITVDDLVIYLQEFFAGNTAVADVASLGGGPTPDGAITVDDLVVYLQLFFAGCPGTP